MSLNNLLITGSTGFIGSYADEYLKDKYNCLGISRKDSIDISNYATLLNVKFDPNIIVHIAASLNNNIDDCFATNVLGTFNICKFAKEKKVKQIILISSISIFNNIENGYYNNYAISKKQSEEVAQAYCKEHNIKLTILRLSQVYDTKGYARKNQGMLYNFIDTIKTNKSISIYGNKNPIRNYTHIKDVLKIINEVLVNNTIGNFNVINQKNHTIEEIAYIIFELYNLHPNISYLKEENDILPIYIPSENIYELENGYISLKDGIKEIIDHDK